MHCCNNWLFIAIIPLPNQRSVYTCQYKAAVQNDKGKSASLETIIYAVSPITVYSSNLWSTGNTIKRERWQLGANFKLFILVVSCNPWCSTVWCDSVVVMGVTQLWLSKNHLSVVVRCSDVLPYGLFFLNWIFYILQGSQSYVTPGLCPVPCHSQFSGITAEHKLL